MCRRGRSPSAAPLWTWWCPARPWDTAQASCSAARAAGVTPLYAGDPGYDAHLDQDGVGVACE
ncbi:excalibur calcium-binding domain-containing protein [Streptomyces sp. NPDC007157]|uniref:excalibur calcium-binding domain-containing protein n=1 Tax=Streptomyces sp. NPDC007157 TaxID=3154681 RepID=UPI0033C0E23B